MPPRRLTFAQQRPVAVAALTLLVFGLAGCAADLASTVSSPSAKPPYIGVFTGEFVDGRPLYRFPRIEVIGSRSSVTHAPSEQDGS